MADMSSPLTPDLTHTFITAELRRVRAVRKWEQPTLRVGEEVEVEVGEDGEDGAREVSTARSGREADDDDDDIFSIPAFMIVPPLETAYVVALFIMQPREAPPPDGFAERDGPEGDDDDHDDD